MILIGHSTVTRQVIRTISTAPTIILVEGAVSDSVTFVSHSTIIKLLCERRNFHLGRHKFFCNRIQLLHQRCICGGEVRNRSTICSSRGCKVRNLINGFDVFLCLGRHWIRCDMKTHGRGSIYPAFSLFLKGTGAVQFELCPCFVWGRAALPNSTVFNEGARLEEQLVSRVDYLKGGVRGTNQVVEIYGVLYLTKQAFNGEVGVKFSLHYVIVFREVGRRDDIVRYIDMVYYLYGTTKVK